MRILLIVALLFLWAGQAIAADAPDANALRLSFGRVMPGEPVEQVIEFANPTGEILEIESIEATPPLLAKNPSLLILAGMNGAFTLVLGPERNPGPYQGSVRVNFKELKHPPLVFDIEGFIIPAIEFLPRPVFFVATTFGKARSASIEIINHRDEPLLLTSADAPSDRFTTALESVEPGKRYRLTLTLDGSSEPGDRVDQIVLHADPPLDEPLTVTANTRIRERVYHFPDSVDMGALPLKVAGDGAMAKTLSQILMVYRPDTDDFQVEASVDLDYIELVNERGPDGDRYQLTLTLLPGKVKPGKIDGTVTIRTNDDKFPVLHVPVTGYIIE